MPGKKKNYQGEQSLGFAFPHWGLYKTINEKAHEPQGTHYYSTISNIRHTTSKISSKRLKLKLDVVHVYSEVLLTHKKLPLKLGNYDTGSHRDEP